MDQEEFEDQASIGERPVGELRDAGAMWPVAIPAASESDARYDRPIPYIFDDLTGRISVAEPDPIPANILDGISGPTEGGIIFVTSNPGGTNDKFLELHKLARRDPGAHNYTFHGWEGGDIYEED